MTKQYLSAQVNMAKFEYGLPGVNDRQSYIQALKNEILSAVDYAEDYAIGALSIRGPAPLQYPREALVEVIDELKRHFTFLPSAEITLFALPGSVTYSDLVSLRNYGMNRISFDMGTFVPEELDAIERTYAPRAIEVFMRMVQLKITFFNYDVTLYYGLPGQTPDSLRFSVEQAIHFMASHITLMPYQAVDNSDTMALYQEAVNSITSLGFEQYTASHFARSAYESVLSSLAYSTQPCLGFGYGAVSSVDGMVTHNVTDVRDYMAAGGDPEKTISKVESLSLSDVEYATLVNTLFNLEECNISDFRSELKERIDLCCEAGLLTIDDHKVSLTEVGKASWQSVVDRLA